MTPVPDVTIILLPACDSPACDRIYAETLPLLQRSLTSIGADPAAEIIVVEALADAVLAEWVREQAAPDRRLTLPRLPLCSPERARNVAIAAARAPLVAFLQAGDVWYPGKLGLQRALHAGMPQLGFSFTDALQPAADCAGLESVLAGWPRFHARQGHRKSPFLLGPDALAQLSAEKVVVTSTVVARTDLLSAAGGFAAERSPTAAWDLWLRLASRSQVACRMVPTAETATRHSPTRRWAAA